jgi:hypothetical protein
MLEWLQQVNTAHHRLCYGRDIEMRHTMKHLWLLVFMILFLPGCAGQTSINVVVLRPEDLTATFIFAPEAGTNAAHSPVPTRIPDPDRCTAFNAIGTKVYLRNYPAPDHDLIATWLPDTPLEAVGRTDNGWYLLRIPPEGRGWVSSEVALLVGSCSDLPVLTNANLRSPDYKLPCRVSSAVGSVVSLFNLPAFDSQLVGQLPQGYLMEARQRTEGGWYYLTDFLEMLPPGSNQGWAYESNLHLNGSCGSIPTENPPTTSSVILASGETVATSCTGQNVDAYRIPVFSSASVDSALLSWILPDESVRLSLRNAQGWVMAEYDAFRGWVKPNELEMSGDCSNLSDLP